MAAKWLEKYKIPKFQSMSLKTVQFGQFFSAGRTGPVSSESRKNPAENRTVVTLLLSQTLLDTPKSKDPPSEINPLIINYFSAPLSRQGLSLNLQCILFLNKNKLKVKGTQKVASENL